MINEILNMNGYGLYVWSSFTFTLLSFGTLYFVTKIQLNKELRNFEAKFKNLDIDNLSPVEALIKLNQIKKEIKDED